ncbi:DNA polymerase kappa [Taenia crassiceps]|uniref:DNA polymerase kappa n=1 Tax=Taenia crassiceps TaxID=6207 RepID=A0ABR4QRX8_9CEST
MEGLDTKTINRIIEDNSKGSKFYENEVRRGAILKQQVERKIAKLHSLTKEEIDAGEKEADKLLRGYSAERRFDRCIVHIDMDAFYAAVEMRDDPSLRLKPLAVGSQSMLSTSNYLARRFGVRAAMPGFLGKKLCPQLTIVPPDFVKYTEVSRAVRSVLVEYCEDGPNGLVVMSLDEVYLNITQHLKKRVEWPPERRTYWPRVAPKTPMLVCRCAKTAQDSNVADLLMTSSASNSPTKLSAVGEGNSDHGAPSSILSLVVGTDEELATCLLCGMLIRPGPRVFGTSAEETVREMRFRVFCATRLTCSAGIAPNSLIAKIASDWNKPNGQFSVEPTAEAVEAFMSPLSIRKVPGIGYVTECRLKAFGVERIEDLRERRGALFHLVSPIALAYYMRITLGHSEDDWADPATATVTVGGTDPRGVCQKSMGIERTFHDCSDSEILQVKCRQLCLSLANDMKEAHVQGKTVTMKFKLNTFEVRSRSQTLPDYTCVTEIITQCASEILRDEMKVELTENSRALTLRLMGVRVSNLVPSAMCQQFRQETLEAAFNRGFQGDEIMVHDDGDSLIVSSRVSEGSFVQWSMSSGSERESLAPQDQGFTRTTCPVCSKQIRLKDLEEMNEHLDNCLSRQTVWDAVQETFSPSKPSTSKSPRTRTKRVAQSSRSTSSTGPLDKYLKMG